jgi:hypothetical protein
VRPALSGPWIRLTVLTLVGVASFHSLLWALGAYSRAEREVLVRQLRSLFPRAGESVTRTAAVAHNLPKSPTSRSSCP